MSHVLLNLRLFSFHCLLGRAKKPWSGGKYSLWPSSPVDDIAGSGAACQIIIRVLVRSFSTPWRTIIRSLEGLVCSFSADTTNDCRMVSDARIFSNDWVGLGLGPPPFCTVSSLYAMFRLRIKRSVSDLCEVFGKGLVPEGHPGLAKYNCICV